jgi:peroxiredoxin Q/BCP
MLKQFLFSLFFVIPFANLNAQKRIDFSLKSANGAETLTLSSARGKYVALHFLLKTECPFCIRHTNDYAEKAASLPNVVQLFIKPDDEQDIQKWTSKLTSPTQETFPIYQDVNASLADRFNIPSGYAFHGQSVHYPALILLDKKGKEVFRYVGKNNSDRFSFDQLKTKMSELN